MPPNKMTVVLPVMMILLGGGWLLTVLGYAPGIDWIWTIAVATMGVAALLTGGWNKITFVISGFFLAASLLSVARQSGALSVNAEVPILVIWTGVLLLIARIPAIPKPDWSLEPSSPQGGSDS